MRLFLDGEWNSYGGELISLALVDGYGQYFYRTVGCADPHPWVAQHVMPVLNADPIQLEDLQFQLQAFLARFPEGIEIVADWPEDIAYFCRLLITGPGQRLEYPPLTFRIIPVDTVSALPHNAYYDAMALAGHVIDAERLT